VDSKDGCPSTSPCEISSQTVAQGPGKWLLNLIILVLLISMLLVDFRLGALLSGDAQVA
jgi:hypothetical protein